MQRTVISNLKKNIEKNITIYGRVMHIRQLGNIVFVILADYSGQAQAVFEKKITARIGDVVEISGKVKQEKRAQGGVEISALSLKIISGNLLDYPYDFAGKDINLNLTTLLDNRSVTLRHPKIQAIFKLYNLLLEAYEIVMREYGFTEIKTSKILETASEGGANFFKIKYFDKPAYLAQSPQLYKQIMVGVFERVFEIGSTFRAEPHFTTRHINEYISLDAEMGFIESFQDVTFMLNQVMLKIFEHLNKNGQQYLNLYGIKLQPVPRKIPHIKLAEIKKIIKSQYKYQIPASTDIDPEGERLAGRYAKEKYHSDFLFITHYPWSEKPFYTMPSKTKGETEGFDLLYKGMEIVTGSQRIHNYKMLISNMKKKKVSPKGLESYLETFKFAMPPHGGWGLGSERLIQQILGLSSIKEAVLFPRDVKRLNP